MGAYEQHHRPDAAMTREQPSSLSPAAKRLGEAAVRDAQGTREHPTDRETDVAWKEIQAAYTPAQVALIRRFSRYGPESFSRIKSAEASPAGALKPRPSRFKPAQSK